MLSFDQPTSRFRDLNVLITPDGEMAFARDDDEALEEDDPDLRL